MPDVNRLPSSNESILTVVYHHPRDIPKGDIAVMRKDMRSNIVLPYIDKVLAMERQGVRIVGSDSQFWIGCYTTGGRNSHPHGATLDFFLSCTDGPIGKYPIFIHTLAKINDLERQWVFTRMRHLVDALLGLVSTRRVFSVFAMDPVAEAFVTLFSNATSIPRVCDPYYAALFSYCTRKTLTVQEHHPDAHRISIRRAILNDVSSAAQLCFGFAAESEPFVLSQENALRESTLLQKNRQLWVLEIDNEIATIVCVTREDSETSGITKVYTSRKWRGRKLAEVLVREVCRQLLLDPKKQRVVLYVAHENKAAAKVYQRVGFVGLSAGEQVQDVEPWIEIGLDRSMVDLGHW